MHWSGFMPTIFSSHWSTIRSVVLREWLRSVIGLCVECWSYPLLIGPAILVAQAWGSQQCLIIRFIKLVSHMTPADPKYLSRIRFYLLSHPTTLSFFILVVTVHLFASNGWHRTTCRSDDELRMTICPEAFVIDQSPRNLLTAIYRTCSWLGQRDLHLLLPRSLLFLGYRCNVRRYSFWGCRTGQLCNTAWLHWRLFYCKLCHDVCSIITAIFAIF